MWKVNISCRVSFAPGSTTVHLPHTAFQLDFHISMNMHGSWAVQILLQEHQVHWPGWAYRNYPSGGFSKEQIHQSVSMWDSNGQFSGCHHHCILIITQLALDSSEVGFSAWEWSESFRCSCCWPSAKRKQRGLTDNEMPTGWPSKAETL